MKRFRTYVASALLVGALVTSALAVAQDGGQGRRRGFGGGGGGRQVSSLMLLRRTDVQADLKLTAEQKLKLEKLAEGGRGNRDGQRRERPNGEGDQERARPTEAEREARRSEMESRQAEMQKNVNAVLTNDQQSRLKEISIQLRGNMALLDEKVQTDLGFTADQKAKVRSLREKMGEASQAIFQKAQDNSITREDAMKSMQKNNEVMKAELAKVLSKSQTDKFKSMQGSTFKADPSIEQRQGGFGRGGRGGGGRRGGGGGGGL